MTKFSQILDSIYYWVYTSSNNIPASSTAILEYKLENKYLYYYTPNSLQDKISIINAIDALICDLNLRNNQDIVNLNSWNKSKNANNIIISIIDNIIHYKTWVADPETLCKTKMYYKLVKLNKDQFVDLINITYVKLKQLLNLEENVKYSEDNSVRLRKENSTRSRKSTRIGNTIHAKDVKISIRHGYSRNGTIIRVSKTKVKYC